MKKFALFFFTLIIFPAICGAASYDCKKTSTQVESLICSDTNLSNADEKLSALYKLLREKDPDIIFSQREWIVKRNQCGDIECLQGEYAQRINFFLATSKEPNAEIVSKSSATTTPLVSSAQITDIKEDNTSIPLLIKEGKIELASPIAPVTSINAQPISPELEAAPKRVVQPRETQASSVLSQVLSDYWIWFLVPVVLFLLFKIFGWIYRCPKCGKAYADKETGRTLVDRKQAFKTITRNDEHRDRNGQLIKTVARDEQVQITKSTYNVFHHCKFCSYEWETMDTTES